MISMAIISSKVKTPVNSGIIKLELAFFKQDFINIMNLIGQSGIEAYKKILYVDFIFPITYSVFLASTVVSLKKLQGISQPKKGYIVLSAIIFDYIENAFHFKFLANVEDSYPFEFFISALASSIKWAIAFYAVFYIVYLLFKILKSKKVIETQALEEVN